MPINLVTWKSLFQHSLAVQIRNLIRFCKHVWDCVCVWCQFVIMCACECDCVCVCMREHAQVPVEVTARSQKRELHPSSSLQSALSAVSSSCYGSSSEGCIHGQRRKLASPNNRPPAPSSLPVSLPPPGSWPAGEPAWGSEVNGSELPSDSEGWWGREWEREELHHTDGEERWENEKMRPNLITIKRWGCGWQFRILENGCCFARWL